MDRKPQETKALHPKGTDHGECCSPGPKEGAQPVATPSGNHVVGVYTNPLNEWRENVHLLFSLFLLVLLLAAEHGFTGRVPLALSAGIATVAYLLAGASVLKAAFLRITRGDIFNEFVLMSVATLGAFYLGAYSEGVAVMVFYSIGEWIQGSAVRRARANIRALLDVRPDRVTVLRGAAAITVHPSEVSIGERIRVRPGEKVALDGTLVSEYATVNAAALTGESMPVGRSRGENMLAGMINSDTVAEVLVTAGYNDSKLSRILAMVQDAASRKSKTQLFISRFAKVYTPVVFFLAASVVVLPYFLLDDYVLEDWLYRALVFLVISCPCALVVSVPLGYFGGIGLASRNGILFKGGNFLDVMANIDTVVLDKTGTLTKGVFKVTRVVAVTGEEDLLKAVAALERHSSHPIAVAVAAFAAGKTEQAEATGIREVPGLGMTGVVSGRQVVAGNARMMERYGVEYPAESGQDGYTILYVAIDGRFSGYLEIADEVKEDAWRAVSGLKKLGMRVIMLSGDKRAVVERVASGLGIGEAHGELLPEDKVEKVRQLKSSGARVAFAGDGVNDAPVVAVADAGIAMGGLGSDATIETADVVIQNDQPSKIVAAIRIGRITRQIVWQNVVLALGVKALVLILGAGGMTNLWEAVIADVGVALLAILNAVRIQHRRMDSGQIL